MQTDPGAESPEVERSALGAAPKPAPPASDGPADPSTELGWIVPAQVRRLALQPGDVLVLRVTMDWITREQFDLYAERMHAVVEKLFPGHEVLVLGPHVALEVVGSSEEADGP